MNGQGIFGEAGRQGKHIKRKESGAASAFGQITLKLGRAWTMELKTVLDYKNPILSEENVRKLSVEQLNDFYGQTQHSFKQYDVFFVLFGSFNYYLDAGKKELAAKLSYLAAYYLFIALTPISYLELALHFVDKAIELHPMPDYLQLKCGIEEDMRQ